MALGDTTEEAFDVATRTMGYEWQQYFSLFGGFTEAFRTPEDAPDRPVMFADEAACTRRLMEVRHALVGTPDEVKLQLDDLHRIHGDGELEWLVWKLQLRASCRRTPGRSSSSSSSRRCGRRFGDRRTARRQRTAARRSMRACAPRLRALGTRRLRPVRWSATQR